MGIHLPLVSRLPEEPACVRGAARGEGSSCAAQSVSEQAILDFLGPQTPAPKVPEPTAGGRREFAQGPHGRDSATPKKSCYRCNKEISSGTHICPYCHTYIATVQDF